MTNNQLLNQFLSKLNSIIEEVYPEKVNYKELEKFSFFSWRKKLISYYLKPINYTHFIDFNDLIGLDSLKSVIYTNTLQFIKGFAANNVLLWGEKGCGKSTIIKSLVYKFKDFNLKLIEVTNDNFYSLEELFDILTILSEYKFIIFLDDISFSDNEKELKFLKSIIEGGISANSKNFLIYATSNRRHMVKENQTTTNEIHEHEAISEKISLSDRFGISVGFYKPDKKLYLKIVEHYVEKYKLNEYYNKQEALNWAMNKGGFSGRAAYQYVISLFRNKL